MRHERYPTSEARSALAKRFRLPYGSDMQDWEWEVADRGRFAEFVKAYQTAELNDAEKFSLMEIIVQCIDEMADSTEYQSAWAAVEPLLRSNTTLHASTIRYWARVGECQIDGHFRVTPRMRLVAASVFGPGDNK